MLSPMMRHYMQTKEEYKDCILFYRLGDFYEMFFEDANVAAKELELTLTGKDCGLEERAPMCGVPYHAVNTYLNKLVGKGYKVAIAEQVEDPKTAKGLVKREVIRVVTPGTISGDQTLDAERNNYLCAIYYSGETFGITFADITTGDFRVTEASTLRELSDELTAMTPAEIIYNKTLEMSGADIDNWKDRFAISVDMLDNPYFDDKSTRKILCEHFKVASTESLGLKDLESGTVAAGAAMQYIYDTQKHNCENIIDLTVYRVGEYMVIDSNTRRNLELVETMRNKEKKGSLLWVLDKTETAMGARLLRSYIEKPLVNADEIKKRQDAVGELLSEYISREELKEYLRPVYDLERLMGRVSSGLANPKDLIALRSSFEMVRPILELTGTLKSDKFVQLASAIDPLDDLKQLLTTAIDDNAPALVREGNIIKTRFNEEVDRLRSAKTDGKKWLAELETREKEKTGIKGLKIKYNKVFGYYFEVTNSFKDLVPEYFIRKQTLVGSERYTTDELKEMEDTILGAEDRLYSLEYDLFVSIREKLAEEVSRIQKTAAAIAELDVYMSLAQAAYSNNYVKPEINNKGIIKITDGRHPVVEKILGDDRFISNDSYLDGDENRVDIITGPNMAGKSTYMRQVALIVLMAQTGSFVPASSADIGICDRIFTRVGASDDLAAGQSTFMVEMTEVANILRNATSRSLIIMDEIGRGTSTFDGLSIAGAVLEYISDRNSLGAKTLFATHYHELTELEGQLPGVRNYCVAVKEQGDDIVFLRKIVAGGADKSYGIQVAKLAGVPDIVLSRAKVILSRLSGADITALPCRDDKMMHQMSLFEAVGNDEIIDEIEDMDLSKMTPIDALNTLYQLQGKIKSKI